MNNRSKINKEYSTIWGFLNTAPLVVDRSGVRICNAANTSTDTVSVDIPAIQGVGASGGVAAVKIVFNKSVYNKSILNKNKNKNKLTSPGISGISGTLIPMTALQRLHRMGNIPQKGPLPFDWANIDIPPPPGPDYTRLETKTLLAMQSQYKKREKRRADIEREASLDISNFTRPLGIDGLAGFEATESLFLEIITVCEYVGLHYKSIFGRLRPNQVEPRLRPLLANPAHEAYPSNHSFQTFSLAYAFNTILPEHPATDQLGIIALNVAQNREWAGLHYPSDTEAGRSLARRFAPYLADAFAVKYQAVQQEWL